MKFVAKTLSAAMFLAASNAAQVEAKFELHFPKPPENSCRQIVESGSADHPAPQQLDMESIVIEIQSGLLYQFNVQSAGTDQEWDTGLMYRDAMAENEGMLFTGVYDEEQKMGVWMKDTYIPLDLIYIRKDGTISFTYENAQPCDETVVYAPNPVIGLLELNAGTLQSLGIKAGDKVHANFFKNALVP